MKLKLNEVATRIYRNPRWELADTSQYTGSIIMEARPYRGKVRSWFKGTAYPVSPKSEDRRLTREKFSVQKHYRMGGGTMSVSGDPNIFGIEPDEATRITDPAEIEAIYIGRMKDVSVYNVDRKTNEVNYYPSVKSCEDGIGGNLFLGVDCFWQPEAVKETETTATFRFKPTLLAQLRHFFTLKPWTYTVHTQPVAA